MTLPRHDILWEMLPMLALVGQMRILSRPNDRPIDYARDVTIWRLGGKSGPPPQESDYKEN